MDYSSGTLEEKRNKDIMQNFRNKYRVNYVFFDEKYRISGDFQDLFRLYPRITALPFQPL
jgi:hypothetical protein